MIYRGKPKTDSPFVEGYLCYAPGSDVLCIQEEETHEFIPVLPETVGRSTGAADWKGTDAFENDIIQYAMGCEVGVIRYGEYVNPFGDDAYAGHVGFYVEWSGGPMDKVLRKDLSYWLALQEIVGNTTDNPEILRMKRLQANTRSERRADDGSKT